MSKKIFLTVIIMLCSCTCMFVESHEVIMHDKKGNHGNNQIYIENPRVTYDDALNELYVYFGSSGTIDLECDDGSKVEFTHYVN